MKLYHASFALAVILLVSASCSIQSRRYSRGYYVKWHRNAATKNPAQTARDEKRSDDVLCSAIAQKSHCEDRQEYLTAAAVIQPSLTDRPVRLKELRASPYERSETESAQVAASGERKADWVGLTAFVLSVGAWFTASYLMLPLSLLAVALSIVSLNRMGKAPEKYVLKTLSLIALILSVAGAALSLFSLILLFFS